MRLFAPIYEKCMAWAAHQHAIWYLGILSFAESSFFPIPPDVMLAPMSLAKPQRAWLYAFVTTLTSVAGGLFGYLIGYFAFEMIEPLIHSSGHWPHYEKAQAWFDQYGFYAILLAGFAPIPYKLFTITAGVIIMPIWVFIPASIIGRGSRFFLVSGLMFWGGKRMEKLLHRYVDWLGWGVVILAIIAYFIWKH